MFISPPHTSCCLVQYYLVCEQQPGVPCVALHSILKPHSPSVDVAKNDILRIYVFLRPPPRTTSSTPDARLRGAGANTCWLKITPSSGDTMTCVRRYQERWDLSGRIMGSLAVSVLTFVVCGIFVLAEGVDSTLLFFCTLGLIVVCGLSTAVLQVRQRPTFYLLDLDAPLYVLRSCRCTSVLCTEPHKSR